MLELKKGDTRYMSERALLKRKINQKRKEKLDELKFILSLDLSQEERESVDLEGIKDRKLNVPDFSLYGGAETTENGIEVLPTDSSPLQKFKGGTKMPKMGIMSTLSPNMFKEGLSRSKIDHKNQSLYINFDKVSGGLEGKEGRSKVITGFKRPIKRVDKALKPNSNNLKSVKKGAKNEQDGVHRKFSVDHGDSLNTNKTFLRKKGNRKNSAIFRNEKLKNQTLEPLACQNGLKESGSMLRLSNGRSKNLSFSKNLSKSVIPMTKKNHPKSKKKRKKRRRKNKARPLKDGCTIFSEFYLKKQFLEQNPKIAKIMRNDHISGSQARLTTLELTLERKLDRSESEIYPTDRLMKPDSINQIELKNGYSWHRKGAGSHPQRSFFQQKSKTLSRSIGIEKRHKQNMKNLEDDLIKKLPEKATNKIIRDQNYLKKFSKVSKSVIRDMKQKLNSHQRSLLLSKNSGYRHHNSALGGKTTTRRPPNLQKKSSLIFKKSGYSGSPMTKKIKSLPRYNSRATNNLYSKESASNRTFQPSITKVQNLVKKCENLDQDFTQTEQALDKIGQEIDSLANLDAILRVTERKKLVMGDVNQYLNDVFLHEETRKLIGKRDKMMSKFVISKLLEYPKLDIDDDGNLTLRNLTDIS